MKVKKKLRIFISNTFYPARAEGGDGDDASVASWELRVEGRLLEDHKVCPFFSLVLCLFVLVWVQ